MKYAKKNNTPLSKAFRYKTTLWKSDGSKIKVKREIVKLESGEKVVTYKEI